jgi:hypothetical protein
MRFNNKSIICILLVLFLFIGVFVYAQLILNPSHSADQIWVSVNGVESFLQDAVTSGRIKELITIKSTLPYKKPSNFLGHGADEVLVSVNGIEMSLQKAIDDGILQAEITTKSTGYSLSLDFNSNGNNVLIISDGSIGTLQKAIDDGKFFVLRKILKQSLDQSKIDILNSCLSTCNDNTLNCKSTLAICSWFGFCGRCDEYKIQCDNDCAKPLEVYSCLSNDECESNLCLDGYCRPQGYCTQSSQCSTSYSCVNNKCTYVTPGPSSCPNSCNGNLYYSTGNRDTCTTSIFGPIPGVSGTYLFDTFVSLTSPYAGAGSCLGYFSYKETQYPYEYTYASPCECIYGGKYGELSTNWGAYQSTHFTPQVVFTYNLQTGSSTSVGTR